MDVAPLPAYSSLPTTTGETNASDPAEVTGQISDMTITDQPTTSAESRGGIDPSGPSIVMEMFQDGAVVALQSVASRRTLCVSGGEISGKGTRDAFSQFSVHKFPSGRIALQNVGNADNWLTVYEGRTLGSGSGGPYAEFVLREIEGKYVALESGFYPGQHVGIREDGELQPTSETPPRHRASLFIPFPQFSTLPPTTWVEPAPRPGELPPPYPGPPLDGVFGGGIKGTEAAQACAPQAALPPYEPPSHMLQPAGPSFLQPPAPVAMVHPPDHTIPTHPAIPLGYELMDLLYKFNSLHLIPRDDSHLTDHPVAVAQGVLEKRTKLKTGGNFQSPASELIAETSPDGNIALRNPASGKALCCNSEMKLFMGDDIYAYGAEHLFTVQSIHGAIVALESVKFPAHFVSVNGKNGVLILERRELKAYCVQFTVYVSRFKGPYSQVLTSPFSSGHPSIVSKLKDRSVIQLYLKPERMYLCLGRKVHATDVEEEGSMSHS
jgi:hypothetical protein